MARKSSVKKTAKKVAKKTSRPRVAAARKVAKKSSKPRAAAARKAAKSARPAAKKAATARRPVKKSAPSKRVATPMIRQGVITHTELASADPPATQTWCQTVLGWQFAPPFPSDAGPYYMWRFGNGTGGGIRSNNPPEGPGSIPYCEVADIQETYVKAIGAGAVEMLSPQQLPQGMGWIAIVAAPGGVPIGFWAQK